MRFSRSSGPGGQHANTADTRVELRFDVQGSATLSDEQKARIRERLGSRLTTDGVLVLFGGEHRSQTRNREAVLTRLAALLNEALHGERARRPTRRPASADRRRLERKRLQSEKKARRRPPDAS